MIHILIIGGSDAGISAALRIRELAPTNKVTILLTVSVETWDHKVYYPGAHPIKLRITADVNTKEILGTQIIGHYQGEVAKSIDIFAAAIFHRMTVEQLNDFDLRVRAKISSQN